MVGSLAPVGLDGMHVICGFGPKGMMEGPAAGKLLAEAICLEHQQPRTRLEPADGAPAAAALRMLEPCREGGIRRLPKRD